MQCRPTINCPRGYKLEKLSKKSSRYYSNFYSEWFKESGTPFVILHSIIQQRSATFPTFKKSDETPRGGQNRDTIVLRISLTAAFDRMITIDVINFQMTMPRRKIPRRRGMDTSTNRNWKIVRLMKTREPNSCIAIIAFKPLRDAKGWISNFK